MSRERLTVRDVLKKTVAMWEWLARNPDDSKGRYFFREAIPQFRRPVHNCYCCEYVSRRMNCENGMPCANIQTSTNKARAEKGIALCPLGKLWPKGCEHPTSPFNKWDEAFRYGETTIPHSVRARCAQKIVNAARKALAALK